MALRIKAEPVPLRTDADGVVRVEGSRVTLDTIMAAFHLGATPEEILQQYPTLKLVDIYAVLAYYLRHQTEVDEYLEARRLEAERVRAENEARFPSAGIRERLMARRRDQQKPPHDPPGGR